MTHNSGRGAARAHDAQGTFTQNNISPSILVHEDYGAPSRQGIGPRISRGRRRGPGSRRSRTWFSRLLVQ